MRAIDIDRVFGRSRLRMVTGAHVEVFREDAASGERRRYTKRFLATPDGDFRLWTEREWRILARLVGHGIGAVPEIVQFDRGATGRPALVQTYDAGITVDHWATLLPVMRDGASQAHVFEDAAHWWALARHALAALDAIHALGVVHLDLKADNICIPYAPSEADPVSDPLAEFAPRFAQLALIDFAFSLVSGEPLVQALPIARQPDYAYQSPRLLQALEAGAGGDLAPTQRLDWRCDLYSLAAMLRRYLPDPERVPEGAWTQARHAQARRLVRDLVAAHDAAAPPERPHAGWIAQIDAVLADATLADALARGWTLAWRGDVARDPSPTPTTRIAPPVPRELRSPILARIGEPVATPWIVSPIAVEPDARIPVREAARRRRWPLALAGTALAAAIAAPAAYEAWRASSPQPPDAPQRPPVVAQAARPTTEPAAPGAASGAPPVVPAPRAEAAARASVEAPAPEVAVAPEPPQPPVIADASRVEKPAPIAPLPAEKPVVQAPSPARAAAPPRTRVADAARSPLPPPGRALARREAVAVARGPAQPAVRAAPSPSAPPGTMLARMGSTTVLVHLGRRAAAAAGSLASTAGTRTPAPSDAPSTARAALPPRIASMLEATRPSTTSGATGDAREATRPPSSTATVPAAPGGGAVVPVPVPTNNLPRDPPIQVASFAQVDFVARARDVLETHVPRVAQRAERLAARALFIADHAEDGIQRGDIQRAADGVRLAPQDPLAALTVAAEDARALGDASREAFARRNPADALAWQTRAFGANPLDANVAGQLAWLHLRQRPSNPGAARSLALHALAVHDGAHPGGRIDDWVTLAIASALVGRDRDARAAWLVALALAPDSDRTCRLAVDAYATWGEPLHAPVEALVYRAHAWNPNLRSPACEWPPRRFAGVDLR